MSHSDNQILQVVSVSDDDEEEEEVGGGGVHDNYEEKKKKKKKQRGFVCIRNFKRAKQVVLSRLKQKPKQPHLFSSSSSSVNAALSGTTTTTTTGSEGCCFCFKEPLTLDSSPVESVCSDPNDPNFTHDMLKALIENNDFYSKESNPHLP